MNYMECSTFTGCLTLALHAEQQSHQCFGHLYPECNEQDSCAQWKLIHQCLAHLYPECKEQDSCAQWKLIHQCLGHLYPECNEQDSCAQWKLIHQCLGHLYPECNEQDSCAQWKLIRQCLGHPYPEKKQRAGPMRPVIAQRPCVDCRKESNRKKVTEKVNWRKATKTK